MIPNISFPDFASLCISPSDLSTSPAHNTVLTNWEIVSCPDPKTHNSLVWKLEQAELLYTFIASKYNVREKELINGLGFIFDWVVRRLEADRHIRMSGGGGCIERFSFARARLTDCI